MLCHFYFCIGRLAQPSGPSPLLSCRLVARLLFLHLPALFVCCQRSDSTPAPRPTNHGTPAERCLLILITSSSAPLCTLVCVCVCVNVNRVFPHLESELCFSSGPFPCSVNSLPLPLPLLQTRLLLLLLPEPPFPVRARQKVGFQLASARELASKTCFV